MAFFLGAGGVAHEKEDAVVADSPELIQVSRRVVNRIAVHLVVHGMDNDADRDLYLEQQIVGDGMVYAVGPDLEIPPGADLLAGLELVNIKLFPVLELIHPAHDEGAGKGSGVDVRVADLV